MRSFARPFLVAVPFVLFAAACGSSNDAAPTSPAGAGGASAGGGGKAAGGASAGNGGASAGGAAGASGAAGGGAAGPKAPDTVDCKTSLPAAASGVCDVAKGAGKGTIVRGRVVAPDHVYEGGEILLDQSGNIACVACDCSATAGYADATKLTCADGVVTPALVNAHEHLTYSWQGPSPDSGARYDYRNQWRKGLDGKAKIPASAKATAETVWFGSFRHALGGTASVSGDEGTAKPGVLRYLDKADPLQEGLGAKPIDTSVFPLGDTNETPGQYKTCADFKPQDNQGTVDGDDSYEPHVSEGINARSHLEFACLGGAPGALFDIFKPQTTIIHGVALTAADAATMAANGTALVWSPRSNISLYGFTAQVTLMAQSGVQIALGTDWTLSGGMSTLRELACAASFNQNNLGGFFSDYQLYRMVTEDAAGALNRGNKIGSLAPGKLGDVTVWKGNGKAPFAAVLSATVADVALVLRGGVPLTGEGPLVDATSPDGGAGCEPLADCLAAHKICAKRETGLTLAALQTASTSSYPLYFCGTPTNEPTCVPSRPNEFTGVPSADDTDGDGIPNAMDLCPTIFSAIRPLDAGKQADADGDGVGDACDPCPLAANTTTCPVGSGAGGMSGAGGGSAAGGASAAGGMGSVGGAGGAPMAMMLDVPGAKMAVDGASVAITSLCVTATHTSTTGNTSVWVQDPTLMADAALVAFLAKMPLAVAVGDQVDVTGTLTTFKGLRELSAPVLTKTGACPIMIAPLAVKPDAIATGGAQMAALMSMLVEVDMVTSTSAPDMMTKEFQVTGGLVVSPFIYAYDPATIPQGTTFTKVVGVLDYLTDHSKLDPRAATDVVSPLGAGSKLFCRQAPILSLRLAASSLCCSTHYSAPPLLVLGRQPRFGLDACRQNNFAPAP